MLNYPTGRSLRHVFPTLMTRDSKRRGRKEAGAVVKGWVLAGFFFVLHLCVFFVIDLPGNLLSFTQPTNTGISTCPSLHWSQSTGTVVGVVLLAAVPQIAFESRSCLSHLIPDTSFPQ